MRLHGCRGDAGLVFYLGHAVTVRQVKKCCSEQRGSGCRLWNVGFRVGHRHLQGLSTCSVVVVFVVIVAVGATLPRYPSTRNLLMFEHGTCFVEVLSTCLPRSS